MSLQGKFSALSTTVHFEPSAKKTPERVRGSAAGSANAQLRRHNEGVSTTGTAKMSAALLVNRTPIHKKR
jgi:hypothetical protein